MIQEYWERINKAIEMIYEYGFDAYPLEQCAIDEDVHGIIEALEWHFAIINFEITEYLNEIKFCCNQIMKVN